MDDTQNNGAPVAAGAPATTPVESTTQPERYTTTADGGRERILTKPIVGHPTAENPQGRITKITLRRPKYRDVMSHGDPETLVVVQGGYVPQTDMAIIERYIGALSGIDVGLLEQLDYVDALALRDAVQSFFQSSAMK
jgi:hypothetical protein